MADITFKFKRGSSGGSSPSGLTHGELAVNTTDNRLFVGSVTGSVNAINNRFFTGISTPSYPIEGDRWYTGTEEKFYYNGNWVTAGGASGSSGSSFDPTQLLVFNSGVSGSGGATFAGGTRFYGGAIVQSGGLSVTGGATITGGVALYGTITVNGAPISSGIANVPLASSSATGVASFGNQFVVSNAGAVGLTSNYVISVNGRTGNVVLPLASSSATGVASFGNQFVVSAAGAVGLTSNYVISVNGSTGTVSFAVPLASSSATGVASFGNEFVVSAAGAVSLTSNYVKSFNGSTGTVSFAVPLASSSATGVASFGNQFVVSAAGAVGLTSNYVISVNGRTGNVVLPVASSSATGVASFGNEFVVSTAGAVGLTSNYVISVNGRTGSVTGIAITGSNTFLGLQTLNAGLTTNHLYVSNGATFANGLVVQAGGISITGGATLTGGVAVYGGLNVSSGTISGTLATAAQTNITSVGTLTRLEVGSGGISSAGGITGTLNTAAQPNITSVGTLTSLSSSGLVTASGGITSNHLHVTNGATFAGTSVHTGLGTFNGGINSSHLNVTNGATFAGSVSATLNTVAQPNITSVGTLTKLEVGSGGISSAGGITGTLNTAAQPNITSVGTLTSLSSSGLVTAIGGITSSHLYVTNGATFASTSVHTGLGTFNAGLTTTHLHVTNGVTFAGTSVHTGLGTFNAGITSNHLYVTNGVTFAGTSVHTGLGTFNNGISVASGGATFVGTSFSTGIATPATFNGGLVSNTINVVSGVTFGSTSYHAGLGTFNEGITSNHLYVTSGATFASGLSVTGGTAYFFRDVYLATGANHPGIVDYEYAANMGITYPSASTPAYTVGDKWSNGSIEYTWNGSAWIENTDNIFSSTPIDFNSIVPSQSITRAKLSPSAPFFWNSTHFFPGKMSWGSSATDTVELPAGSITAAGYQNANQLTTRQYVDDAVAGIYNATQTIGPFTVLNDGGNTSLSIPEKFDLNRKYYVNWSVNATNGGDRFFDIYCQAPAGYGIIIYPFYNNFIAGKGFSIQFPSTADTEVSIGGIGGGTASYASGINIAIYRIKQTNGGGVVPIQKGCFIYEIVPLLVL